MIANPVRLFAGSDQISVENARGAALGGHRRGGPTPYQQRGTALGKARGLRRLRRNSADGNQATAQGRDEPHWAALRQGQRPLLLQWSLMRSATRKMSRRWRYSSRCHGIHPRCWNKASLRSSRVPQMWSHLTTMLRMRCDLPWWQASGLTLKRQVSALAEDIAVSPTS